MIEGGGGTIGVVGTGVIGSGWVVRALAAGRDVVATDPAPGAEGRLRAEVERAWPAARRLGLLDGADPDRLEWAPDAAGVAARSGFVQEAVPEREDLKRKVLAEIDAAAPPGAVIASSSSGLLPSRLQADCPGAERVLVGHPFNPVYLLPLVEIVAGDQTSPASVEAAAALYRSLGMHPLVVRREIDGYVADRLQEALWREALHLVDRGIATTAEVDDAIVYGPGLRWAGMGTFLTYHLAGGPGGMGHFLDQFGPALDLPWTDHRAPPLTPELRAALVAGTAEQAHSRSPAELADLRDDYLLAVMQALRPSGLGAGRVVASQEARRLAAGARQRWREGIAVPAPLSLYSCRVEPEWVDYNLHMGESFYLYAFGWASDALFRYAGIDEAYREAGHSFYTVESHINYLAEATVGDLLTFTTQVLAVDAKRLHFFHTMSIDGEVAATTEQMLLHVDTAAGRTAPILDGPRRALEAVAAAHAVLLRPANAGRVMEL